MGTVKQFLSRYGGVAEAFMVHIQFIRADSWIPTTYDGLMVGLSPA
jgi:hypothetical protein